VRAQPVLAKLIEGCRDGIWTECGQLLDGVFEPPSYIMFDDYSPPTLRLQAMVCWVSHAIALAGFMATRSRRLLLVSASGLTVAGLSILAW